jgi:hypothetical protein
VSANSSWEDVARGVLDSLSSRDITPGLAEDWLNYILKSAESGEDISTRPEDWAEKQSSPAP